MASLQAKYMDIELKNPVIAGASELSSHMSSIKQLEEAGVGALVIKSLFEEQIQLEKARFEEEQEQYNGINAEMTSIYPAMEHSGPEEHLMWVRKAKESLSIPIIASLNAVNSDTWVEWAKKLENTGVDGLELNFFANPELQEGEGAAVERDQIAVVAEVVRNVVIPVSIKMSLFYTAPLSVAKLFVRAGAKGLVLFNRFFQPDIDVETETALIPLNLSVSTANRLPLRYMGL
ncbi:Putative dihydropyrimidine dehydrogenase [NADP+], similar to dihydroorotate dehydrogenase, partial [Olavius algarvensis spirochete endosymbiont]|uniref:dihydroorotate dehydrogenase n=1 Tax=Olavius algarvensis spirochete endosymbiont TaxID=260710 RepID=UPI000F281C7D